MSILINIYIFLIATTISCYSTYINPEVLIISGPPDEETTTANIQNILEEIVKNDLEKVEEVNLISNENIKQSSEASSSPELNSDETKPVFTGKMFEIHLTIKEAWNDEFVDSKSKKFAELSKLIDTDLISFFDNQLIKENSISRGSFVLKNVLPSSTADYLYVTFVAEASDNVTGQIMYEKIENWLLLYNKFYELEFLKEGFSFKSISNEELEKYDRHVECDSEFCKPTPHLTQIPTFLTSDEQEPIIESSTEPELENKCTPNEKFNHKSTSIYIFENDQKCIENVRKQSFLSRSQNFESKPLDISGSDEDSLEVAPSENHPQISMDEDDEVVVVVRKRGDKVFIEI